MTLAELKRDFYRHVYPAEPNDWEAEDVLEKLVRLSPERQQVLLSFVPAVWPVSHSLCFSYLEYGAVRIGTFDRAQLADWVRQLLGCYERDGLRGARSFMEGGRAERSADTFQPPDTRLVDVRGKLLPFIHGVSGMQLDIAADGFAWTDSETIFLPEVVNYFLSAGDNERLFTFLTCCQWGYILLGTLNPQSEDRTDSPGSGQANSTEADKGGIEAFFTSFPDPALAASIFHYLEFSRVYRWLSAELPGLMRSVRPLLRTLVTEHDRWRGDGHKPFFAGRLLSLFGTTETVIPAVAFAGDMQAELAGSMEDSCRQVAGIYAAYGDSGADDWPDYERITGRLRFDKVRECARRRRLEHSQLLIQQLAVLIESAKKDGREREQLTAIDPPETAKGDQLLVVLSEAAADRPSPYVLTVNNITVELPPELQELLAGMQKDLGKIPEGYVQAAAGIAGRGVLSGAGGGDAGLQLSPAADAVLYDEWDYRRQGYRKDWCTLIEKDVQPVKSHFVDNTLERYRGSIVKLRRQFEMLRTQHRFIRRRRHGDDIDFDALVEAVGDRKAGLAPSERLFVRLLREERDIAVMFLVDMSNSTEGWVGTAIKESLVLLGDVLEIVGDRYGIYGFSGMRRSRCELFRIKGIDEPYSEQVQQRICAISPREYTRMAPPLRHLTRLLMATDARVRLLIAISDGKPEDYDDYKGDYAIEDTRQALIEARGKGVIPFCITVDREPHAYLPHMFGKGNYIYVDGVEKLPRRMPEIYRLLTS